MSFASTPPILERPGLRDVTEIAEFVADMRCVSYFNPEAGVGEEWVDAVHADFREPETLGEIADNIRRAELFPEKVFFRVLRDHKGTLLGLIHALSRTYDTELVWLFVDPDVQTKGIGTLLMEEFDQWADPKKPSYLDAVTYNKEAVEFHRKNRFGIARDNTGKFQVPTYRMMRPVQRRQHEV